MLPTETLRRKYELCKHLDTAIRRIDPGYSEIRTFIQQELNFSRLLLSQQDLESGRVGRTEYSIATRQSLKALDELEQCKKLIQFNCG